MFRSKNSVLIQTERHCRKQEDFIFKSNIWINKITPSVSNYSSGLSYYFANKVLNMLTKHIFPKLGICGIPRRSRKHVQHVHRPNPIFCRINHSDSNCIHRRHTEYAYMPLSITPFICILNDLLISFFAIYKFLD